MMTNNSLTLTNTEEPTAVMTETSLSPPEPGSNKVQILCYCM